MKTVENFYAKVEKVLTSDISPDYNTNSYNEYSIIVTTEKGNKFIVGQCSEVYCLIPTIDIFPPFEEGLKVEFKYKASYRVVNLSQFYVDYIFDGKLFNVTITDQIVPMIRVVHSYNKSASFKVMFGFYRLVCSNGLFMFQTEKEYKFKHFLGNRDEIFAKIRSAVHYFIDEAEKKVELFKQLNERKISNFDERVEEIIKATHYLQRSKDSILNKIASESNGEVTDWIIYNAFNFVLNSESIGSPLERRMKIDREIFNWIVKHV